MKSQSESYRKAGVDVTAGYETVKRIKPMVESTYIPGVIGSIGGFGGLFQPDLKDVKEPVFVSGTDGVGTKLKIAFSLNKHDSIGIDCVAMCVNDIVCSGAKPLFFLDYLAVGKLDPATAADIVSGVAEGCRQAGCALVGGETAEMPGFYTPGEYDLAGFSVGMADKQKLIDGSRLEAGDVIIGIPSSGLHSNGFSLARKVFGDTPEALSEFVPELGKTIGEALIVPTRIYVKDMLAVMEKVDVKAVCHITGGGFYENIPRMLKEGTHAVMHKDALPVPPVFKLLAERGNVPERDMYNTFNMGLGMAFAVPKEQAEEALKIIPGSAVVGEITEGETGVTIC